MRNNFEQLKFLVSKNVDVLLVAETNLDDTCPTVLFLLPGFRVPCRLDRNKNGGGILAYIREEVPSKDLPDFSYYRNKPSQNKIGFGWNLPTPMPKPDIIFRKKLERLFTITLLTMKIALSLVTLIVMKIIANLVIFLTVTP